jgi:signal transduction protein with GAF and PtsI domain
MWPRRAFQQTELEEFILALDAEIRNGLRAEQALRQVVTAMAERIRQQGRES